MFRSKLKFFLIAILMGLILISPIFNFESKDNFHLPATQAFFLPTSVIITVCGNGVLDLGEICDDGINNGRYAYHSADKFCDSYCTGYAPYCGNGTVESDYGEECDDGNNTSGDGCASNCKTEVVVPPPSGGGGGGVFIPSTVSTQVVFKGKAYPGSNINILKDGKLVEVCKADLNADFEQAITDVSAGIYTFGLWAEDKDGMKSITYTLTFGVTSNTITTVSGIFLPPTINIDKVSLDKGEILNIFGQTIPEAEIDIRILSEEIIATTTSDNIGAWLYSFNTEVLEEGSHVTKARLQFNSHEKSGFGQVLAFYIGREIPSGTNLICSHTDLNKDGETNLIDFSILLYWWNKENACADQNMNGVVDLADFSIMLYYWTG